MAPLTLADAATVEFAPGLRRPPSLGTPPPPPRPGDPLYQDRLGRAIAISSARRWRVVVPVVCVGLIVIAIGVGLAYIGDPARQPRPPADPPALAEQLGTPAAAVGKPADSPAVPSPTAAATTSAPVVAIAQPTATPTTPPADDATPPAPPPAALTGPASVAFGVGFSFTASGFTCAGTQLVVTLAGHSIPAGSLDGAGHATIVVNPAADGQVPQLGGPPDTFVLGPGSWTLHAATPDQAGCTASAADATITVT